MTYKKRNSDKSVEKYFDKIIFSMKEQLIDGDVKHWQDFDYKQFGEKKEYYKQFMKIFYEKSIKKDTIRGIEF
jgi:hypothetical protein